MKILLVVLILGLSASFFYQQLQLSSLKSKQQLLNKKTEQVDILINQASKEEIFQPTTITKASPELSAEISDRDYKPQIDRLELKITTLENHLLDLQKSRVEFENKMLSFQQQPPPPLQSPGESQLSATEQRELSIRGSLEKQQNLMEKLTYEEVKTDWALPMENKITDSFAANDTLSNVDVIQAQCKTTLCEINIYYNPTSDEDLIEFENEILVALGENLTNVHGFQKDGTMDDGYSFTLIASP